MKTLKVIKKIREYLNYLEEHLLNVQRAWMAIQEKCNDMDFMQNDSIYERLGAEVLMHDMSKTSEHEFIQFRKAFHPSENEIEKYDIDEAWEHHKKHNMHHWESWTSAQLNSKDEWKIHCVHMVIDWMAMEYQGFLPAKAYYEKNKDRIKLPDEAIKLIYQIFERT